MNTCSDGHQEVVYITSRCPACDLVHSLKTANQLISNLEDEITRLQKDLYTKEKIVNG